MYIRISKEDSPNLKDWWANWGFSEEAHSPCPYWEYELNEGSGFLAGASDRFDYPTDKRYDPARCGAFSDWLEENEDRLLEGFSTEDRPLAQERLQALRQWLRSGFQPKE